MKTMGWSGRFFERGRAGPKAPSGRTSAVPGHLIHYSGPRDQAIGGWWKGEPPSLLGPSIILASQGPAPPMLVDPQPRRQIAVALAVYLQRSKVKGGGYSNSPQPTRGKTMRGLNVNDGVPGSKQISR